MTYLDTVENFATPDDEVEELTSDIEPNSNNLPSEGVKRDEPADDTKEEPSSSMVLGGVGDLLKRLHGSESRTETGLHQAQTL